MKLNLEQIQAISAGVLNVWEEDGVFHFAKCTRKVIDAWYELDVWKQWKLKMGRLLHHTNLIRRCFLSEILLHKDGNLHGIRFLMHTM